ncbi:phosphoglycolate phosphatase [Thermomonas aquatica]|uniref:phosphoglycolate phosphatase n=2 Tax=Thermomonas aquatica TaxID=2202149 RepID=A0A5B7ZP25_9GAMM|nr:phosphoglycolate phosphatase [Thermomonas aquatica]QDA56293.1 phosphoglycolate phosphatase [Thermomonas aquatica]
MTSNMFPKLVLFDLDGTLLDSAPDMAATVNRMRAARGQGPMPLAELRPHVSKGSRAMSAAAFPELGGEVSGEVIREFLDTYEQELGKHSVLFDGVAELLDAIEADGSRWGIVTNKPEYLARQVLPQLGWDTRCAILVGGDSLPQRKPHPLPLLHSAETLGVDIADCVYVGDDQRDIDAARAAGMRSVVALWGYRPEGDDPHAWGGDVLVESARDLLDPALWSALR